MTTEVSKAKRDHMQNEIDHLSPRIIKQDELGNIPISHTLLLTMIDGKRNIFLTKILRLRGNTGYYEQHWRSF